MMMCNSKFSIAALIASLGAAAFRDSQPNQAFDNGTVRMHAEHIRSEKGGLADVFTDTDFKLDDGNQSYWFMDTSALYQEESDSFK